MNMRNITGICVLLLTVSAVLVTGGAVAQEDTESTENESFWNTGSDIVEEQTPLTGIYPMLVTVAIFGLMAVGVIVVIWRASSGPD